MKQKTFYYHFLLLVLVSQLCWAQILKPGLYVREMDPKSYVEIKSGKDSLFYLAWDDRAYYGKYGVKDDTLICVSDYGYGSAFVIRTDYLINFFIKEEDKWLFWKGGKTASEYTKEKRLWLHIQPGQTEESLTFTQRGEVVFDGKKIAEFTRFDPGAAAVQLSPPSPRKSLALCLLTDYDKGSEQAYILDMKNKRVLPSLEIWADGGWIKWTPDENYAVASWHQYAGGSYLSVIDLTKDKITSFTPIKLEKEKEYQTIDFESFKWISPKIFRVRVNVKCDYYAYEREPEKSPCYGKSDNILRVYDVQVNISTLAVSYKRIK